MKKVVLCLLAALAPACASCGNHNLYPVSGSVTYKGSPATGATVFFHRRGGDGMNDQMIMGIVREDGSFELVGGSQRESVPPGDYDVLIEWKKVSGQSKGRPQRGADQLNGRYANPKRPLLHATVEAKATNLPSFELK